MTGNFRILAKALAATFTVTYRSWLIVSKMVPVLKKNKTKQIALTDVHLRYDNINVYMM